MSILTTRNELKISIHDIVLSENGFVTLLRPDEKSYQDQMLVVNIGFLEAQLLTVQFNKVPTARPLIIDMLNHLFKLLHLRVVKVLIHEVEDNVFLSKIFLENTKDQTQYILDSKTSDALIFALSFNAEIFAVQDIITEKSVPFSFYKEDEENEIQQDLEMRLKSLNQSLKKAIQEENYEMAIKIRDEIKKLKGETPD